MRLLEPDADGRARVGARLRARGGAAQAGFGAGMMLWLVALACNGGPEDDSSASPDDSVSTDDSSVPKPDECDGHEDEILCIDGEAVTCDAAGNPTTSEDCASDPSRACFEGQGCGTCTPALTVAGAATGAVAIFVPHPW